MIELDALILILIGVALGSVLGTEYANWRIGRRVNKLKKAFFKIIGVKEPTELTRQSIVELAASLIGDVLKQAAAVPTRAEETEESAEEPILPDAESYKNQH